MKKLILLLAIIISQFTTGQSLLNAPVTVNGTVETATGTSDFWMKDGKRMKAMSWANVLAAFAAALPPSSTNLSYTASPTNGIVTSDTGTDATIPSGSTTNASLMLPADKIKLNAISGTNTGDQGLNSVLSVGNSSSQNFNLVGSASTAYHYGDFLGFISNSISTNVGQLSSGRLIMGTLTSRLDIIPTGFEKQNSGFTSTIDWNTLTAHRNIHFPNADGNVALEPYVDAKVANTITDGFTTSAPNQDVVYDALQAVYTAISAATSLHSQVDYSGTSRIFTLTDDIVNFTNATAGVGSISAIVPLNSVVSYPLGKVLIVKKDNTTNNNFLTISGTLGVTFKSPRSDAYDLQVTFQTTVYLTQTAINVWTVERDLFNLTSGYAMPYNGNLGGFYVKATDAFVLPPTKWIGSTDSYLRLTIPASEDYWELNRHARYDSAALALSYNAGDLVPKSYVDTAVAGVTVPDATTSVKGIVKLAGDLEGTAALPTVKNASVIGKVLTGYTSGAGIVTSTDSIIEAIQKLDGNDGNIITAVAANYVAKAGLDANLEASAFEITNGKYSTVNNDGEGSILKSTNSNESGVFTITDDYKLATYNKDDSVFYYQNGTQKYDRGNDKATFDNDTFVVGNINYPSSANGLLYIDKSSGTVKAGDVGIVGNGTLFSLNDAAKTIGLNANASTGTVNLGARDINLTGNNIAVTGDFGVTGTAEVTGALYLYNVTNHTSLALGSIVGGKKEYNGSFYETNSNLNRLAIGGKIKDFTTAVSNVGTAETDLFTYTTKASTLAEVGEDIVFTVTGTFNDVTATTKLKFSFGGTVIGDTGTLTVSSTGAWVATVKVKRTGSTTATTSLNLSTPGASTASYTNTADLTGLTFSNTNIIKVTGTAGGAGGGTGDITAKMGDIFWTPSAQN